MKTQGVTQNVQTTGSFASKRFTADWTGHAAKMLSDTLYSDKISAVIRELSTNAWDSHLEANNLKKIHVHLPTLENPNFIIRDFGTGINDKQMQDLYTIYFKSTKQDSNKFNGTFGIGRMSFLAYNTKTCNIEAIKDGVKVSYFVYYGVDSVPVLSKLTEEKTQEPNGVKITIPVRSSDFNLFKEKAEKIYQFFDVIPEFSGNIPDITEPKKTLVGPDFYLVESTTSKSYPYRTITDPKVIMGNVAYPLKLESTDRLIQELQNHSIHIKVPIGSVNFDIGREKLSYNDNTVKFLTKKLNEIIDFISQDLQKKIDDCKCKYDAMLLLLESPVKNLVRVTYNGTVLTDVRNYYSKHTIRDYNRNYNKASSISHLPYKRNILLLEHDKRDVRPRIANELQKYDNIYTVEFNESTRDVDRSLFLKNFGMLDMGKVSDYTYTRAKRGTGVAKASSKKSVGRQFIKNQWSYSKQKSWKTIYELPKEYVMIHVDKYDIITKDISYYNLREWANNLASLNINSVPIIGVSSKVEIPKGKGLKEWLELAIKKKIGATPKIFPREINSNHWSSISKKLNIKLVPRNAEPLFNLAGLKLKEYQLPDYPLLKYLSYHTDQKLIEEYIDLVDFRKKTTTKKTLRSNP